IPNPLAVTATNQNRLCLIDWVVLDFDPTSARISHLGQTNVRRIRIPIPYLPGEQSLAAATVGKIYGSVVIDQDRMTIGADVVNVPTEMHRTTVLEVKVSSIGALDVAFL